MFPPFGHAYARIALPIAVFLPLGVAAQQGFSFSQDQEKSAREQAAAEAARQNRVATNLSTPAARRSGTRRSC